MTEGWFSVKENKNKETDKKEPTPLHDKIVEEVKKRKDKKDD